MSDKKPISPEDLYRITLLEEVRLSPDGAWIAYVQRLPDKLINGYKTHLWLAPTDGGQPWQITHGGKDSAPRWSPDGRTLAFLSDRGSKAQVYLLPVSTPGEARPLTQARRGVKAFSWSPDGRQIVYLAFANAQERAAENAAEAPQPPADKLEADQRKARDERAEAARFDPRRVWRIPYRAGTRYLDDRHTQLYLIDVSTSSAKARRLTSVDADHDLPEWSPDSKYIYTARSLKPEGDEPDRALALHRIRVADGQAEVLLKESHQDFQPKPSPDGKWIAFGRYYHADYSLLPRVSLTTPEGIPSIDLNTQLARSPTYTLWGPDSQRIYFSARDEGHIHVFAVPPLTHTPPADEIERVVGGQLQVTSFDVSQAGLAFAASTALNPSELYWQPQGADEPLPLTQANAWLQEAHIAKAQPLKWDSPDGTPVQGWYMLPPDYQAGQRCPLILNIHGGPHMMWGPADASMWHEWQTHTAAGYAVFYCNPRGSDGYGEQFRDGIRRVWGVKAYEDIMSGLDAFLKLGFVDEARMGITGGSYGGYVTAWIAAHTDRFKAAVAQRGVYNLLSFYGTTDAPYMVTREFKVDPWEDPTFLWQNSPLAHAHKIKAPLLLIHAENDFRVPIEQAEQLFAYVRRSGGTAELLRFPRDGHEMSRSGEPAHRLARLEAILNWMNKYVR